MKYKPIDIKGKDLQLGDWVRVIAVPLSIQDMPNDTKIAFSKAVGETLQIESFDETGCLELDFCSKLGCDTIQLEPFCVERFRRYKKFSKRFQKILKIKKELELPEHIFTYKAIWPVNGDYDSSLDCFEFEDWEIGHGWAVWEEERRIEGTFSIHKHKKNSLDRIQLCRQFVSSINYFEHIEVSEIKTRESNKKI